MADTAYTLNENELRVGLWSVEYGIFDAWDVGTYILPWVIPMGSLYTRWQPWKNEDWATALKAGVIWLDIAKLAGASDSTTAKFWIFPLEAAVSYKINDDLRISLGTIYTQIILEGAFSDDDLKGAAAVTNLQLTSTFEWRISDVTAMYVRLQYFAYQDTSAQTASTIPIDEYTEVEVIAGAESDVADVPHGIWGSLGFDFSWTYFNMRTGLGYGNYMVPGVNFVLPTRLFFPELDFYWRW